MSKDLFEQRIGETLRNAESAPPAGAWELIQSRIQAPYTPPFSFPTWAVVTVSTILLGAMSLSDIKPANDDVPSEYVAVVSTSDKNQLTKVQVTANTVTAEVVFADRTNSAELTPEEVAKTPEEKENSETIVSSEAQADEVLSSKPITTKVPATTETNLPVTVKAVKPWTEELTENTAAEDVAEKEEEIDQQNSSVKFEPEFSVEGVKTCYTPCEINLTARGNASEYAWDAATFGFIQGESLNITIDEAQSLTVYAIAKYADGSERTIPQTIEVKRGSKLFVPNSFTPNGDGTNDNFSVTGNDIVSFSMTIINSKGKVVFKTNNINESWNFTGSNLELENEVYTAIVRAVGTDGRSHTVNQRLTIIP